MWWRWLAEVQTEHQNGEERGFKWLWTWNGCWCQTGLSISKTADLLVFSCTTISRVYREWSEKRKYPVSGSCVDEYATTNWASFKHHSLPEYYCCPCPSLYDYSVHIFWCYFQQDNAPCHKAQIISDWFLELTMSSLTQMASTVTRSQSNRAPLGCGGTRDSHHGCCSRQICSNCVMLSWVLHARLSNLLEWKREKHTHSVHKRLIV